MEKVNNCSPFNNFAPKKARKAFDQEYISYIEVEKVKEGYDPSRPYEFVIEKEVIEDERIPIAASINANRNRIGLKNMLKGIVSKKQMAELIEKTQSTGGFVDATKLPDSHLAMEKLAGSIDRIWSSIPEELRGSLSKEEFLRSITADKIKAYAAKALTKEEQEGN